MPNCNYCEATTDSDEELADHLTEAHDNGELSRVDQRRVEQHTTDRPGRLSRRTILATTGGVLAGVAGVTIGAFGQTGPTKIQDWDGLNEVRNNPGDDYELDNDLDATTAGYSTHVGSPQGWEPIGTSATPFTGSFDGLGYSIRDLVIDRPSVDQVGLFGVVGGSATVQNVGLPGADVTGNKRVGGLAGQTNAGTSVTGSSVGGRVETTDGGSDSAGGLVGRHEGTEVLESYATATIVAAGNAAGGLVGNIAGGSTNSTVARSYATGDVNPGKSPGDAGDSMGGLVGLSTGGIVEDTYATGDVTGGTLVGGVAGEQRDDGSGNAAVRRSYAIGQITAGGYDVGGVAGRVVFGTSLEDSYTDTTTTGVTGTAKGFGTTTNTAGLTTDEMQGASAETNMSAFDFGNTWSTVTTDNTEPPGTGYPILTALDREAQLAAVFTPLPGIVISGDNVTMDNTTVRSDS